MSVKRKVAVPLGSDLIVCTQPRIDQGIEIPLDATDGAIPLRGERDHLLLFGVDQPRDSGDVVE
jgi:hypothetical protein